MTSVRRLLQKNDKSKYKFSRLNDRTIRRLVKKLETDCTLDWVKCLNGLQISMKYF